MEIAMVIVALCAAAAILSGPLARLAQLQQEDAAAAARGHGTTPAHDSKHYMVYVDRNPGGLREKFLYDITPCQENARLLEQQARIAYPESDVWIEDPD